MVTGDWWAVENLMVTIVDLDTSLVEFWIPISSIDVHLNVSITLINSAGVTHHHFTMCK